MFEKFGFFESAEELIAAAAGFLAEGDEEALFALAQENGLDKEDAEDYLDGIVPELATPVMAAAGRLKGWREELVDHNKDLAVCMAMKVILGMLQTMAADQELAGAVMKEKKSPEKIYDAMAEEARKHVSGAGNNRMAVSCGTDQELRGIILAFYLKPQDFKKKIKALYVLDGGAS